MPNLFVFEGGDGSGKSTQVQLLAEAYGTRVVRFPSYDRTPTGRMIGDMLHATKEHRDQILSLFPKVQEEPVFSRLLQALMAWDRYSCDDLWNAPEKNLVLDRYFMSGIVFGALDGIPTDELLRGHRGLPQPEVAFLLDLPVDIQMKRLEERGRVPDIFEAKEGLRERLERIRELYRRVWTQHGPVWFPKVRWVVIDARPDPASVAETVKAHIPPHLRPAQRMRRP